MKISKLGFVDKSRYARGVELDPKVQLATVAIAPGKSPDPVALAKAVDDAGYAAAVLYRLNNGKLQTTPLSPPSK